MRKNAPVPLLLAMVGAAFLHTPVRAQTASLRNRLAAAKTVTCDFSVRTSSSWVDGTPGARVDPTTLSLSFTDIDSQDGTAVASRSLGDSLIVVRYSGGYLHLMEVRSEGPLYTTTVFAQEGRKGRLLAVHTRIEYTVAVVPGYTSRPELYVGECDVQ